MPISSGDLTNMRTGNQTVTPHLNVTPKVVMGTMQVNETYLWFPEWQFTFDNASWNGGISMSDVAIGSQVWIGTSAGLHDVMVTTVTNNTVANQIFTPTFGQGDPGYASLDVQKLADDQYVTLLANRAPWGALSTIRGGTFYKQGSRIYVDQGSAPPPVCNIGPWRRAELSGASVTLSFTNAAQADVKPASFAWTSGSPIASYSWTTRNEDYDENAGCSFDGGIDNTEGVSITFTVAGFYIVSCTVQDNSAKTHTADTYVWIVDGSTEADLTGWRVENDTQTRQGRRMTIQMYGDVAESVVFPGAGFLYTETQTFNDNSLTAGATVDTFVGFVDREAGIRNLEHGIVEFDLLGPGYILDLLPAAPQYVEETASPANWTQVTSDLTNPNGIAWYILAHHAPNMIAMFDFWPLQLVSTGQIDYSMRDYNWVLNGKSIWAQLKEITPDQINIGSRSNGALMLRHEPYLLSDSDKGTLDSRMTWTAADIREKLEYPVGLRLDVGQVDAYAFSYNDTTGFVWWSRAPGDAQSQGKDKREVNGLILSTSNTQSTLNRISGAMFAALNNPTPRLVLKAMRNMDTADPAAMLWHKLTISDALDPRGSGYTDRYILPLQVNRRWQKQNDSWLKEIDITFEVIADGEDGMSKQVPINVDGQWLPESEWPQLGDYAVEEPPDPDTGPQALIALSDIYAKAARTSTSDEFQTTPVWEDISTGLSGAGRWMTADPFNYQRYYAVTTDGLYVCDNVLATTPQWYQALDTSRLPTAGQSYGYHHIAMSGNRQGWICLAHNLVHVDISTDYGASWNTYYVTVDGLPEYNYAISRAYWGSITPSGWNTFGTGYVYYRRNRAVLKSEDWGKTWDTVFAQDYLDWYQEYGAGSCTVPYIRLNGVPNTWEDDLQVMYINCSSDGNVAGPKYSVIKTANSGNTWQNVIATTSVGEYTGINNGSFRPIVAYTPNSNPTYFVERQISGVAGNPLIRVAYSNDAGGTLVPMDNAPTATTRLDRANINGWPYDPDFLVFWTERDSPTKGEMYVTFDRGQSAWTDVMGNLATIFGDDRTAYVEAMLNQVQ